MPFCAWLCKKPFCGGDLCCGKECGGERVFHAESGIFRAGKIVIGQHLHADAVGKGLCESSNLFRLIGVIVRHKGIADLKRLAAGVDAAQILKDTAVGAPRGGDVDILIDGFEVIEKSIGVGQQLYGAAADARRRREKDDFCRQFSVVRAGGVCALSAAGEKFCGDAGLFATAEREWVKKGVACGDVDILIDGFEVIEKSIGAGQHPVKRGARDVAAGVDGVAQSRGLAGF